MKLRNKKTGEIVEAWSFYYGDNSISIKYFTDDGQTNLEYHSLNELNEEWEDYNPAEPLIKDKKVRKAVRAWAEANEFGDKMAYIYDDDKFALSCWQASIDFNSHIGGLEDGKEYSFDELCGEEEE